MPDLPQKSLGNQQNTQIPMKTWIAKVVLREIQIQRRETNSCNLIELFFSVDFMMNTPIKLALQTCETIWAADPKSHNCSNYYSLSFQSAWSS